MAPRSPPPITALSRRAKRLLLLALAPLLPLAVVVFMGLLHPWLDAPATRWAAEHWWLTAVIAVPVHLLIAACMGWLLRCPDCGYRLARAGIRAQHLIAPALNRLSHCPACGCEWHRI
jgi:hypothetical protein